MAENNCRLLAAPSVQPGNDLAPRCCSSDTKVSLDSPSHNQKTEPLRFVLVIPVYNEEQAIAGTLQRALAAGEKVLAETPVTEMTIVVVNDGSTDRTQEIVDRPEFAGVVKVSFPENRGYGAAIKAGFQAAPGELVGFIDADGTCDPAFSVQLINRLLEAPADVVVASRLNTDSRMPRLRRLGNWLFAKLLNLLAGASAVDVASGFRVLRRASLKLISPLPDGMHFTPAMSCVCVLDPRLWIEEVPMPYEERIGRSKLNVLWDGLRFLSTILFSFCCYSPIKSALAASLVLMAAYGLLFGGLSVVGGSSFLLAWAAVALALLCLLLVWAGLIVHQLNYLLIGPRRHLRPAEQILQELLHYRGLAIGGAAVAGLGSSGFLMLGLLQPSPTGLAGTAAIGGLILLAAIGMAALTCGLVTRVIWAVSEKQKALVAGDYEPSDGREIWKPGAAMSLALTAGQRSGLAS